MHEGAVLEMKKPEVKKPVKKRYNYLKRYGGMMTGTELHRASYTATNRGPSKPKKGPYEI